MMKLAYIAVILAITISLPQSLSFHRCSNLLANRESRSRQSFALPAMSDLSQIVSTTITSATIEVASNEIVAKQIFEPQMSAETGIGIVFNRLFLFFFRQILSFNSQSSTHSTLPVLLHSTFFFFFFKLFPSLLFFALSALNYLDVDCREH
jgi:hypothetical protein